LKWGAGGLELGLETGKYLTSKHAVILAELEKKVTSQKHHTSYMRGIISKPSKKEVSKSMTSCLVNLEANGPGVCIAVRAGRWRLGQFEDR
jgi:hypothetical protein